MKNKIYFLLAFIICVNISIAQVVNIGNGIQEDDTPIALYYNYSYSQSIYLASEIGQAGNIYRIKYKGKQGLSLDNSENWVVYIGHTTNDSFTANNWIPTSAMTEVFNGTVAVVDNNVEITLITPFSYNGTDNLVIAVDENSSGYAGNQYEFLSTNVSNSRSILYKSDSVNPDPTNISLEANLKNSIPNIDLDFNATACNAPTNLMVSNPTITTVDLSWTQGGGETIWNIEYGPKGFALGSGTSVIGASESSYNLSGLMSSSIYDFYVQANCGTTQSGWAGPFTFATVCEPYSVPYFEGFENGFVHDTEVSHCLDQESIQGTVKWIAKDKMQNSSELHIPRTGNWNSYLGSTNKTWLYIPLSLNGGTSYTLQMYARYSNNSSNNITIKYGTQNNALTMTNTIVNTTQLNNSDYQKLRGDFTPTTSGTYYIGIYGEAISSSFGYLSIDDIKIIETPSCLEPDYLTSVNITPTSVNLDWQELGTANTWNIEYGPVGFTHGNGTYITGITTKPYTLTGLTSSTDYDVYVYADCGGGDVSIASEVHALTTDCEVITSFPFIENFENIATGQPDCWKILGTTTIANYHWSVYSLGNNDQGKGLRFNSYINPDGKTSELITQAFDLSGFTAVQLKFNYKNPAGGNFEAFISTDGGATYVSLENNLTGQASWVEKIYDISSYISSNVKIKFHATSNYGNGDAYIYLDNVSIEESTLSVDEIEDFGNAIKYYPNPVKEKLILNTKEVITTISLMNMNGQEIYTQKNINANNLELNMLPYNNGVYFIRVSNGTNFKTSKIVKE